MSRFQSLLNSRLLSGHLLNSRWTFVFVFAAVFCVQILHTASAWDRLQFEEISESIRNPYWVKNGSIYDGLSGITVWYFLNILNYELFGFQLYGAKLLRLALASVGLFFLLQLLTKYLPRGKALFLFVMFSLSPTFLFLNTYQSSYGTDLCLFPIVLYLLDRAGTGQRWQSAWIFGAGLVAMSAALTYYSILLYFPVFYIFFVWQSKGRRIQLHLPLLTGLLLPLAISYLYLENGNVFLSDPKTGSGVFRGGGGMNLHLGVLSKSIGIVLGDLFVAGKSYYFQLPGTEFVGLLGILSCVVTISLAAFQKDPKLRLFLLCCGLLILFSMVLPNLTSRVPGLRRCTGALVGFYGFAGILLYRFPQLSALTRKAASIVLLCIVLQHLYVIPQNIAFLERTSGIVDNGFLIVKSSPEASIEFWYGRAEAGLPIDCIALEQVVGEKVNHCRLQEFYPILASPFAYRELPEPDFYARLPELNLKKTKLERRLWDEWVLDH